MIVDSIFKNKRAAYERLLAYGFAQNDKGYVLERVLPGSNFVLTVNISRDGKVSTTLVDPEANEPYTLHLIDSVTGSFVGEIRLEFEKILLDIAENCFDPYIFKSAQANAAIEYISKTYGNELEFLWKKFPDNAIWRRSDNKKWYALLLTVSASKMGFEGDEKIEVIDLRMDPSNKPLDGVKYLPAYHMNKNSWLSIVLDRETTNEELLQKIAESYILAGKSK